MSFSTDAEAACTAIRALFPPTPLQRNAFLSDRYNAEIYLKREDLSPVRSYKIRGAMTSMARVADKDALFVCASAGNHAQGVAYACKHFGVRGVIYMPVTTPAQKVLKTQTFGGELIEIVLEGDYFDETLASAQAYCAQKGGVFLPPYDSDDVILGQATVGVEILQELETTPDMIVAPVGGGGLSSGLLSYFKDKELSCDFKLVEPMGGRSLFAALSAGHLVTIDAPDNFVDGAAVARIGERNFEVLRHVAGRNVLGVPEDRLCTTIIEMLNIEGIVLEPAGALAVDALKDLDVEGKTVVCVTSGGNFDFERLPDVKERALRFEGLKKYFILRMPQRPGALKDFLNLLGPHDDIARFEYLKKSARNFGTVLLGIETTSPAQFPVLCSKMEATGITYTDITNDTALSEFLI